MTALAASPALAGFALGGSLIVAIGAQNAFVLRQGLRRRGVLLVASLCTACDWLLIALGAGGFGSLVARSPALATAAAWLGAAFLGVYGAMSLRSAFRPAVLAEAVSSSAEEGLLGLAAATLAVSLLNPHVLLDTIVLIGGISAQYPPSPRIAFALGASAASAVWFFSLAFGARLLAPVFARPAAWRVLDASIAVVMWVLAASLVARVL